LKDLKTFRKEWSSRHKELRELLKDSTTPERARKLFYIQHAVLHTQKISEQDDWSYADEIFIGINEDLYRIIPENGGHSLLWILWHISRIEDITMNILVGEGDQVYLRDGWKNKIGSPLDHTGNEGSKRDLIQITAELDPAVLLEYRAAVGFATRSIVRDTPIEVWNQRVEPARLTRLVQEGAVLPNAKELLDYWGKRRIFELFLMPPTRHLLVHLNEAYSLLKKLDRKK